MLGGGVSEVGRTHLGGDVDHNSALSVVSAWGCGDGGWRGGAGCCDGGRALAVVFTLVICRCVAVVGGVVSAE